MGIEWLNAILDILNAAGIRAGEAYPPGKRVELSAPAAALELRDLNYREGTGEVEVRILSPAALGGWKCQAAAAEAVAALENAGISCRMEPMKYETGTGCFEMRVIGTVTLGQSSGEVPVFSGLDVSVGDTAVGYVTEFSAEQNRKRRLIGTLNQPEPVGVTVGAGGWSIRMVQEIPVGGCVAGEPQEPFELKIREQGLTTVFHGCCWNRWKKTVQEDGSRVEWEGFALTREELADGEAEV